ncbi:hypothetical protein QBC44DRAFT_356804 [Cladorrhinum sp. PSN332]|nr:hypothetical protein QBC44DRAFT_356804 [Cladorrhinum sp. PSN332]
MAGQTVSIRQPRTPDRKLRSSCNSCGNAKVRCDRQQPECRRCKANGTQCVYGASRRFGRPPGRRTSVTTTPVGDKALSEAITQPAEHVNCINSPSTALSTVPSHPQPSPPLDLGFLDPQLLGQEWGQLQFSGNNIATSLPGPSATSYDPLTTLSRDISGAHSCALEPYEIFANLICPAKDMHPPESNSDHVAVNLDQVLHCNRKAIDRLIPLLKCPCSASTHRLMVHASIISRILMWYQQAAGWASGSSGSTAREFIDLDDNGASGTFPSLARLGRDADDLTRATGYVVIAVPPSLGTFGIEDENMQARIGNQLILSEVEKMSGLIEVLGSHIPFNSSSPGNSVTGMHALVAAWIRKEHSDLVNYLKVRCAALDGL